MDGFIPYDNSRVSDSYFENSVILDVWKNKREIWANARYVGVVSWRFFEKTGLTYKDIVKKITDKDIYLMTPPKYIGYKSPLSANGFGNVCEIAKIADSERLFPFDLYEYDIKYKNTSCTSFCNFFLVTPGMFDYYCSTYLKPTINWLETSTNPKLKKILETKVQHRDKKMYPVQTFFLEGLFQCFTHYNNFDYEYILKKLPPDYNDDGFKEIFLKQLNLCHSS